MTLLAPALAAAVGEIRGPIRGVVEDVADVRTCWLNAEKRIKELEELPATVAAVREQLLCARTYSPGPDTPPETCQLTHGHTGGCDWPSATRNR